MTFYDFMMEHFSLSEAAAFDDTCYGDFAYDLYFDKNFPRNSVKKWEIKHYLLKHGACYECLEIFQKCWKMYKREALL